MPRERDYAAEYARRVEIAEGRGFGSVREERTFRESIREVPRGDVVLDLLGGEYVDPEIAEQIGEFLDSYEPGDMSRDAIREMFEGWGFDEEFFESDAWYAFLDELSPPA